MHPEQRERRVGIPLKKSAGLYKYDTEERTGEIILKVWSHLSSSYCRQPHCSARTNTHRQSPSHNYKGLLSLSYFPRFFYRLLLFFLKDKFKGISSISISLILPLQSSLYFLVIP